MPGEGGNCVSRVKPRDWVKFEHASVPVMCVVSRVKRPVRSVSYSWCGGREAGGVARPAWFKSG